jgi:hypothetical protein
MAKPISPSYPVTGKQAEDLIQEIDRANRGKVDPGQQKAIERNMEKALDFFRNAASILSSKK